MGKIVMRLSKKLTDDGTEWRIASHSCLNGIDHQLPVTESTKSTVIKPEFVDVDDFMTADCENGLKETTYNREDPLVERSSDVRTLWMVKPTILLRDCFSPTFFDNSVHSDKFEDENRRFKDEDEDEDHAMPSFIDFRNTCQRRPPSAEASVSFHRKHFICDKCSNRFTHEWYLKRHQNRMHAKSEDDAGSNGSGIFHSIFNRRLKLSSLLRYSNGKFSGSNAFAWTAESGQGNHRPYSSLDKDETVRLNEDSIIRSSAISTIVDVEDE